MNGIAVNAVVMRTGQSLPGLVRRTLNDIRDQMRVKPVVFYNVLQHIH